jgi:copper chaperone CopZ
MSQQQIKLSNITCSACQKIITKRLGVLPGVKSVDVNIDNSLVTIDTDTNIPETSITKALEGTPYKILSS